MLGRLPELQDAVIIPRVPEQIHYFRIEYLDKNEQLLFESPHVPMAFKYFGTKVIVQEGKADNENIIYTITERSDPNTTEFGVRLFSNSTDIADFKEHFKLVDTVYPVKRFRITDLARKQVRYHEGFDNFFQTPSPAEHLMRRLVTALDVVEERLGIKFKLPKSFSETELADAELVASILNTGSAPMQAFVDLDSVYPPNAILVAGDPAENAQKIVHKFEEQGHVTIFVERWSRDAMVNLFGSVINLGKAIPEFNNCHILNYQQIKPKLSSFVDSAERVEIHFEIDRSQLRLIFVDWPK